MEWNKLQTIHLTDDMREKLSSVENYLSKQDYFDNTSFNRSRVIDIILTTFFELFVEKNSRTKYPNRLAQLKQIVPKDNEKLLIDVDQVRQMQDILAYISLANYQALLKLSPDYAPEELRSFNYGDSKEINILINRILALRKQDVIQGKQYKDTRKKKK